MVLEHEREAAGPASTGGQSEKHHLGPETCPRHRSCQNRLGFCVGTSHTTAEFEPLFQNPVPDLGRLESP